MKKRLDQRSDPKPTTYKISRKLPDPLAEERGIHPASTASPPDASKTSNGSSSRALKRPKVRAPDALHDEQIAMPFVVPRRIEAQPFLKWVGGKAMKFFTDDQARQLFVARENDLKLEGSQPHSSSSSRSCS